jgi:hypothetical protein
MKKKTLLFLLGSVCLLLPGISSSQTQVFAAAADLYPVRSVGI